MMVGSRMSIARWRRRAARLATLCLMSLIAFAVLYPLLLVVFTAFKTEAELVRNPLGLPHLWTGANLARAWYEAGMRDLILNSLLVSGGVVIGVVILSSMGAFALARMQFPGRALLPILLTVGLVLPFQTLMIPLFYTFKTLGLLNTRWAMILPQVGLGLPFGILLLRSFILDLPQDLFDAAEMDGCGLWSQYRYLILPLTKPGLIALAVFEFLWSWNEYLVPLVMVQDAALRTIPLGLGFFVGRFQAFYTGLAAAALIAFLPSFGFYLIFHRQVLRANLAGALK